MLRNPNCCMDVETEEAGLVNPVMDEKRETEEDNYRRQKEAGKCMVCGAPLGRTEDVVWCRHCGRLAHRAHLMDWITTKKCCPACGARLDERYYG